MNKLETVIVVMCIAALMLFAGLLIHIFSTEAFGESGADIAALQRIVAVVVAKIMGEMNN
jgi:hypothetical protein